MEGTRVSQFVQYAQESFLAASPFLAACWDAALTADDREKEAPSR